MQNKTTHESRLVTHVAIRSTLALCLVVLASISRPAFSLDILVGSSQTTTSNYYAGRALCRLINSQSDDLDCRVLAAEEGLHSSDQIHTLTNVRNGALDLGIVDSAIQYHAINRSGQFEFFDIGFDNLRALFSLNGIPFTVVARNGESLQTLSDLKGKKINIGNPGSPQREIMDNLMRVHGWQKTDFQVMEELPATQQQDTLALCLGTVDAVVRFNVHPNSATKHMVDLCNARLMNVSDSVVNKLISEGPFYATLSIPGGMYGSNSNSVSTFGLLETVITTEDLDEDTAYTLVKLVFEHLERLKSSHTVFNALVPDRMHTEGMSIPLHPGAERYYSERGWIQ